MKRFIVVVLSILVGVVVPAQAADKPKSSGGLTLSPAFQEVVLHEKQSAVGSSFSIANNTDQPQTYEISSVDMGTLEDTGGIVLSGLPEDYRQKYGLAKWLQLSLTQVTVKPHNHTVVSFVVKNEDTLSPGGHYGALVVQRVQEGTAPNQKIALSAQAASLILLRKVGGERYGLDLAGINSDRSMWRLPTTTKLTFRNTGNVHLVPRGIVRVKNMQGKEIARGIINPESGYILPEKNRTFSIPLTTHSRRALWPGRYTLEAEYRYDGQEEVVQLRQNFFTANLRILLLLFAGLFIMCTSLYRWRRYIRRLFRRVQKLSHRIRIK